MERVVSDAPAPTAKATTLALDVGAASARGLMLETRVTLPDPTALLPLDDMAVADMVRELVAVSVQREAETMAALETMEKLSTPVPSSPLPMPAFPTAAVNSEVKNESVEAATPIGTIHGTFSLDEREWTSLSLDAVAAGYEGKLDSEEAMIDYTLEESGGLLRSFFQSRSSLSVEVGVAKHRHPTPPGGVHLNLAQSHAITGPTLAYCLPRPMNTIAPGIPTVGPCPARDAVAVLKQVLGGPAPPSLSTDSTNAIADTLFTPNLIPGDTNNAIKHIPCATSMCRVFPHSHLTAAQSEERVQALTARIRDLTGYDFTPPQAPIAPSNRLSSTHIAKPCAPGGFRSDGLDGNNQISAKQGRRSGSSSLCAPTPIVLNRAFSKRSHSAAPALATPSEDGEIITFSMAPVGMSGDKPFSSPLHSRNAGSLFPASSPLPFAGRGGGGQLGSMPSLLSPVPSTAAPPGALTPASTQRKTISRFLSSQDHSRRSGASPAHFDREHHQTILSVMQVCGGQFSSVERTHNMKKKTNSSLRIPWLFFIRRG